MSMTDREEKIKYGNLALNKSETLVAKEKERLLNEASDILKVCAQRWSRFTTGERAANWLRRFEKINELK